MQERTFLNLEEVLLAIEDIQAIRKLQSGVVNNLNYFITFYNKENKEIISLQFTKEDKRDNVFKQICTALNTINLNE